MLTPTSHNVTVETPPLARRKPNQTRTVSKVGRNTSACAEKTPGKFCPPKWRRKHLRLRGENSVLPWPGFVRQETPPLARRKRIKRLHESKTQGNTSACAEKTRPSTTSWLLLGKHLRLRGENGELVQRVIGVLETPPLARRKPNIDMTHVHSEGNTSACAEKTSVRRCREPAR
ncbi:hypothetical protein SAMN05720762_10691 [Fibrobacter sp. UWH4]|nr:hypothetical protein SAMN05720762_10691 [Fibrobacter sp. UWH4]